MVLPLLNLLGDRLECKEIDKQAVTIKRETRETSLNFIPKDWLIEHSKFIERKQIKPKAQQWLLSRCVLVQIT